MRLLTVQKDIGLAWLPGLLSTIVSLFIIIVQSELQHEKISILKLLLLILFYSCLDYEVYACMQVECICTCRILFFFFHFPSSSKSISKVFIFHIFMEKMFVNFPGYWSCIIFLCLVAKNWVQDFWRYLALGLSLQYAHHLYMIPLKHFFLTLSVKCSLLEFIK